MRHVISYAEAFCEYPLETTWFEIRAAFFWIVLCFTLPATLPFELSALRRMYYGKGHRASNFILNMLCRHRLINLSFRGPLFGYVPRITLRGSIALWLITLGRHWQEPSPV